MGAFYNVPIIIYRCWPFSPAFGIMLSAMQKRIFKAVACPAKNVERKSYLI